MKKTLFLVLMLALMGGAMAQNQGPREYVSVLLTFRDTNSIPQDSLNKYGVLIQTQTGRMATALIDAQKYHDFLAADLVERVTPSTRVFLRDDQVNGFFRGGHHHGTHREHGECDEQCEHHGEHHGNHRGPHHGDPSVRHHQIPTQEILNDEAKGWYLGLELGGSSNYMDVENDLWNGNWYTYRGLNLEVLAGYQFNQWFGIRSGINMISKNYITDLNVIYNTESNTYRTFHNNMYLQLPVMADLSMGSEVVRLHFMFGGYVAWWATQFRNGYVYVADDPRPFWGQSYSFVEGYDNRFDAGLAGGLGLTLQAAPEWQLHFEGKYYHSLISTTKAPYDVKNRTWTFGLGVSYHF